MQAHHSLQPFHNKTPGSCGALLWPCSGREPSHHPCPTLEHSLWPCIAREPEQSLWAASHCKVQPTTLPSSRAQPMALPDCCTETLSHPVREPRELHIMSEHNLWPHLTRELRITEHSLQSHPTVQLEAQQHGTVNGSPNGKAQPEAPLNFGAQPEAPSDYKVLPVALPEHSQPAALSSS